MASNIDMSLDDIAQQARFSGQRQFGRGAANKFRTTSIEKPSDLRSVLAKKQTANISDLRSKLKPKALYTSRRSKPPPPLTTIPAAPSVNGSTEGRKKLKLTTTFKNSISSAVAGPSASEEKPSSSRLRRNESVTVSQRRSSNSSSASKLPSYEEAKKISVTVPGSSKPVSEYTSSHRREERLAAQIMRSKEMRQEGYMKGREEFLASTIPSAMGGVGSGLALDGGGRGVSSHVTRVQRGRSPSPVAEYRPSYDPLISSSAVPSYSSGSGSRQRGITTSTSMIISNLSDTVSKNDVAELCSVVGALDSVYMHAPGIAEVVFKYKDDALEAYKKYNQRNLDGQPMHCKLQPASRSRVPTISSYGHSYMDEYYSSHGAHGSGFY